MDATENTLAHSMELRNAGQEKAADAEERIYTIRADMQENAVLYVIPGISDKDQETMLLLRKNETTAVSCTAGELIEALKIDTGVPLPPAIFIVKEGDKRSAEDMMEKLKRKEMDGMYIPDTFLAKTEKPLADLDYKELVNWLKMNAGSIEQEREAYQHSFGADMIDADDLKWSEGRQTPFSTGFDSLDQILDGGLYPEALYSIGALSSLGKTTFCLQIADHIAAAGHDVLYVALEQSASELRAKTLSRLSDTINHQYGRLSVTQIMNPNKRACWQSRTPGHVTEQGKAYADAIAEYKRGIGQHMRIIEGVGNITVERIRGDVEKNIRFRGVAPVVIIDYAQILAPAAERLTDKQNVDRNIVELKRLARDKHIPVIAICSFNRDNYFAPVDKNAFKESGAIEYSADVLIGIQPKGMIPKNKDEDATRNKTLVKECMNRNNRDLEAVILKNRSGEVGTVLFEYFTPCNSYTDKGIKPKDTGTGTQYATSGISVHRGSK